MRLLYPIQQGNTELKTMTDLLATLRELRAYRHRRTIEQARQIVERDAHSRQDRAAHDETDRALDEALMQSFPASDPIALSPRPTA